MAGLIVVLILIITVLVVYLMLASSASDGGIRIERPPIEEELLQARLDLHRIERGVDLTLAKQDQRREAERVKEAIAEALGEERQ